jgi:hypothetical protein
MRARMPPGSEYCNRTATRLAQGPLRVTFFGASTNLTQSTHLAKREQVLRPTSSHHWPVALLPRH